MAHVGQAVTFAIVYTNSSDVETNPTSSRFFLREGVDGVELQWTYNAAPVEGTHYPTGANPIVRGSAGNDSVEWVARKPERLTGFWHGAGNDVDQTAMVTYFVTHTGIAAIDGV